MSTFSKSKYKTGLSHQTSLLFVRQTRVGGYKKGRKGRARLCYMSQVPSSDYLIDTLILGNIHGNGH